MRVFGYEDAGFILPKLILCLGFGYEDWRRDRLPAAEDTEHALSNLVLCLGFWIRGCRAHPTNVGWYFVWVFGYEDADFYFVWILYTKMSSSCQSWYFLWVFGYEEGRKHPAKVDTLSGFLDTRIQS